MNRIEPLAVGAVPRAQPIAVADILPPENIELDVCLGSRKKMLHYLSELISRYQPHLDQEVVFKTLNERERLGSTAVGSGIALPHARLPGLDSLILAVLRLQNGIEYDAPDNQPIWLVVCLLVPDNANDAHLNLLARLAAHFQRKPFLQLIRTASTVQDVYRHFLHV